MFTIKNIVRSSHNPDAPADYTSDSIRLWEGTNVTLQNRKVELDGEDPYIVTEVAFDMPDGVHCTIDTGIVYVMNANGKTVETFRLKNSEAL